TGKGRAAIRDAFNVAVVQHLGSGVAHDRVPYSNVPPVDRDAKSIDEAGTPDQTYSFGASRFWSELGAGGGIEWNRRLRVRSRCRFEGLCKLAEVIGIRNVLGAARTNGRTAGRSTELGITRIGEERKRLRSTTVKVCNRRRAESIGQCPE